jgi:hypothetical protein
MPKKGKTLEELGLKSAPLAREIVREQSHDPGEQERAWAASRKYPLELFLQAIERMREDGRWDFADQTLTGIYDSATKRQDYTLAMKMAVEKIYASIAKHWEDDFDLFVKSR